MPDNGSLQPVFSPDVARELAARARQHPTYPAAKPGMRPRALRIRLAILAFGAVAAGLVLGGFGIAHADEVIRTATDGSDAPLSTAQFAEVLVLEILGYGLLFGAIVIGALKLYDWIRGLR